MNKSHWCLSHTKTINSVTKQFRRRDIFLRHLCGLWHYKTRIIWNYFSSLESQNGWGWKEPLEVKQSYLEPVAQNHVEKTFEYLQGWRLHSLTEQPVWVLHHPHSTLYLLDPPSPELPSSSVSTVFTNSLNNMQCWLPQWKCDFYDLW